MNRLVGVTAAVQTQIDAKGAIAGQTWTGTHTFSGTLAASGTITVVTQALTDDSTKAASTAWAKAYADNKFATVASQPWNTTTTATSKTLSAFEFCRVTASGQTITLPASPTAGVTRVGVAFNSGVTGTLDPGSEKIMDSAGTMTCSTPGLVVVLLYLDSTKGWVLGA